MMEPLYYVRHPDDTFSVADPQPQLCAERPAPVDARGLAGLQAWLISCAVRHEQSIACRDPIVVAEAKTLRGWATALAQQAETADKGAEPVAWLATSGLCNRGSLHFLKEAADEFAQDFTLAQKNLGGDAGRVRPLFLSAPPANSVVVSEWISVKDRLPEEGTTVLAFNEGPEITTSSFNDDGRCEWRYDDGDARHGVTHWMSLPAAPTALDGARDDA